jgi:hypothetical protein
MAASLLKGALISFTPTFVGAAPNVTVFQFNPETITHNWTASGGAAPADKKSGGDPLAVSGLPGETFNFTLFMDSNEDIADGDKNPIAAGLATQFGLYTRLAALEMLQYPLLPPLGELLGTVSAAADVAAKGLSVSACKPNTSAPGLTTPSNNAPGATGSDSSVPRNQLPVVLFVWGVQCIVPVRIEQLGITAQLYDAALRPTHAEVQITLRVLTPDELVTLGEPMKTLAKAAYVYTQALRQAQAALNLGNAAIPTLGMLPTHF